MGKAFCHSETDTMTWPNGAVGHRTGAGTFDCLGPYAKVESCPVDGRPDLRVTAYATGYADTFFSVPACAKIRGKYLGGFFTHRGEEGPVFVAHNRFADRLPPAE